MPFWLSVIIMCTWTAGVLILVQALFYILFEIFIPKDILSSPWVQSLYIMLSDIASLFIIVFIPYFRKNNSKSSKTKAQTPSSRSQSSLRRELGLLELPTWTDLLIAPIGYFVYLLLSYSLFNVFSSFSWFNAEQTQDLGYNYTLLFGSEKIFTLIVLLVIVPVVEEIIFRGFLYGKLRALFSSKFKSTKTNKHRNILLSATFSSLIVSILFGTIHGQWNVGIDVFAMSMVQCALREITDSIYPGILIHIIKNSLAFFVLSSMLL